MANKVNVNEIDERMIVAAVRKDRIKQEITPPPLEPLPATVPETTPENVVSGTVFATPETTKKSMQPEAEVSVAAPDPPKEEVKRKRKSQDYEVLFIKEVHLTARLGKTVYIRKEFHDRITKIVQVPGMTL
jgi:hypothetical protein